MPLGQRIADMAPEGRLGMLDSLQEAIIDAGKGKTPAPHLRWPRRSSARALKNSPNSRQPSRRFILLSAGHGAGDDQAVVIRAPVHIPSGRSGWYRGIEPLTSSRQDWLGRSAEQRGRAAHDLVLRDILKVLGQTPPVAERIDDLPVAFTPESVLQG